MLVSVIIPTFNRAHVLGRAVESVLAQSMVRFEVIVVDDGSTDATGRVLAGFDDSRLRCLHLAGKGVSAARNAGIELAQGELIALLDSDDAWLPGKLEQQLRFLVDGGWQICQTEEVWVRHGRRVNPGFRHRKKAGWLFEPSLELCLVSPSSVLFTRSLFRQIGPFDEQLPACEDYDFWLRVSLLHPIGLLPGQLVVKYGGHPDQLSRKLIGLDLYRIYSLSKLLRSTRLSAEQRRQTQTMITQKAERYIQGCVKRDKPEEALRIKRLLEKCLI
jgi:glycosyltransferase involved in cell wall biosynthesis